MTCLCNIAESHSSTIKVTPEGVTLPKIPADFIKLANWNVEDDEVFAYKESDLPPPPDGGNRPTVEQGIEVFYGFDGVFAHQLFPSSESEFLPIKSLSDISLRCREGQIIRIKYSYFIKEKTKK